MPTTAQPQKPLLAPGNYTGMDDVLVPSPNLSFNIKSDTYPVTVLSVRQVDDEIETGTRVHVTTETFNTPVTTLELADKWIARHSTSKVKPKHLTRGVDESISAVPVFDDKGKVFSPVYKLTLDSQGAQNSEGRAMSHHLESELYRQIFHFLPISANTVVTTRIVRAVEYFQGFPQFEGQYQHFLATLKRDTATAQSTLKAANRTRVASTQHFSVSKFSYLKTMKAMSGSLTRTPPSAQTYGTPKPVTSM